MTATARLIEDECLGILEMLLAKNRAYGDSAINPVRIFSQATTEEQILVRLDDKLSRLARGGAAGEDVVLDLIGYLVLLRVARRHARDEVQHDSAYKKRLPSEERKREEPARRRFDEGGGREAIGPNRSVQAPRQVGKKESGEVMDPKTGQILVKPEKMSDEDWAAVCAQRNLVPIKARDLPALKGMNRKQRRTWLSKQRCKKL